MKILITGNLGYVGAVVTRHLRARYPAATLIGADTGFFAHCLTGARSAPELQLDGQWYVDVRRPPTWLLDGVDAIVHLAAISNDPMGRAYEELTMDVNYRATVELARAARARGVRRFVFASSCSVYGAGADGVCSEESPVNPLTTYAHSKLLAEDGLAALAGSEFIVTCLRFATACGMSDRLRLDLVLNDFVASSLTLGRIEVLSDGTPWRPLIDVADMARAMEWALQRDGRDGGPSLVINAGRADWNIRIQELAEAVAMVVPGTTVSIAKSAPADRRSYRVDFSLFESSAPAHQPRCTLAGTVAAVRDGLLAMRFAETDFRNSSLIRLRVLADLQRSDLLDGNLHWTARPYASSSTPADQPPAPTGVALS